MIIIVFLFHYRDDNEHEIEMNVNMLDQLILLVQLSDVSVTCTNGYFYWCDVFYYAVHMEIYCNIINVIQKEVLCFISSYLVLLPQPSDMGFTSDP